ncbi:hypothetical protein H6G11_16460 [Cyanobacterium aponinum FACHB-4101]|uniref:hypothetical protein n=1 Tax=Cyanobacterium aponinum TaxID=379064 RepID=UPI001680CE2D|nr:hypothetical protein [Cyanobacterium aponinum]MBD2395838.1 hypothetical protein [Cyanobacterium aponinum FACHB-4101]
MNKPKKKVSSDSRRQGKKAMRGQGIYYDEAKEPFRASLTPTVREKIDEEAKELMMTRSELLELIFRERYNLPLS